jgi:hypothetical protein
MSCFNNIGLRGPIVTATLAALSLSTLAAAVNPPMGGPMNHLMVMSDDPNLMVMRQNMEPNELKSYEQTYDGPAAVLNGTAFNAQYGWMTGGFFTPPSGAVVVIEQLDATPGLTVYRGGTFEPIFGTDGSPNFIVWNGTMLHNWYAVTEFGTFEATYAVYFADETTLEPLGDWNAAQITVDWVNFAPADVDRSGAVGFDDLLAVLAAWGACDACPTDIDGNGTVDFDDLLTVLAGWS